MLLTAFEKDLELLFTILECTLGMDEGFCCDFRKRP